ncbi:hypothetical protein PghCCS26_13090 [Paenibacillus glycanilyticus]|uniref:HTH merR-type domain-containing protein n=1 Tax=Paenibacillus glycanilyticus TaxID=126569 RepID=A0ABQ6NJ14_9BACL|nr:hypothetical protein PghCCS26_13090 [Paenibacillus glycanilyticus]
MKLSRNSLRYFVREGYINHELNSKGVRVISQLAIDEFNKRYIISTEISKMVGIRFNHVVKWLGDQRIFPVNPIRNHEDHQYLFIRNKQILQLLESHNSI